MGEIMSRIRNKAHIFLSSYERMNSIFENKFGYSLYFIGGTLLGYVRENDFLANDKDMDVSYFSKYENVEDVRKELIYIVNSLLDDGEDLFLIRKDYSIVKNYFRWSVDERDRIDIMPSWYQDGMLFRPTFVGYKGTKDLILPLHKKKFYNHDVYIPNNPETKLANVYGDDWRIPDPSFKKGTRKNDFTQQVIDQDLCYGNEKWKIVKKTNQWKELSFFEKTFMTLIQARRNKILARIIPNKNFYSNPFFKGLRKIIIKKKKTGE